MRKIFILLLLSHIFVTLFLMKRQNAIANVMNNECDVLTAEAHLAYLDENISETTVYSSNINKYHNYLTSYYDNLTYNLGMNYKGSCGYVAIGMILSYYDTFLDDSIIPEQYDMVSNGYDDNIILRRNSPGILRDLIGSDSNPSNGRYGYYMPADEYYNIIASMSNISLHAKLLTIGASRGYYDFSEDYTAAGTNFAMRYNIINDYLTEVSNFDSSQYTLSYVNCESDESKSNEVREFAIERVQNNQPVLLSISGASGSHAVVAYDYDEASDELYCHFGYGASKTYRTIESENFYIYKTALTIDFNISHAHSNNYGITTVVNDVPTTSYYCFESPAITLINHEYNHSYFPASAIGHTAYCECGSSKLLLHNMVSNVCSDCGYTHSHTYSIHTYYNDTHHKSTCPCGDYVLQYHVINISSSNRCLSCNALVITNNDILGANALNVKYITENGSYILPSGIVCLVNEDIASYFDGTLIFFDRNTMIK